MSTASSAATVAASLWQRRKHLVLLSLLFVLAQSVSAALAFLVPQWKAVIDPFGGPFSLTGPLPRLDVVFLALVFTFCWFRLCLRESPETSGLRDPTASLFGPPQVLLRFLAHGVVLLIVAGAVFLGSTIAFGLSLEGRPDIAVAIFELGDVAGGLLTHFVGPFLLLLPVVLLAPLLMRVAMVLPVVAAGRPAGYAWIWSHSRHAWRASSAMLAGLAVALVLVLPTDRLAVLLISKFSVAALLLLLWIPFVLQLAKAMIAGAILAEVLTDRYESAASGVVGTMEKEAGPLVGGPG